MGTIIEILIDRTLLKGVVTGGNHIGTGLEYFLGRIFVDPVSFGAVFPVHDTKVDAVTAFDLFQVVF
ncbi:hypothetical protein SDC9_176670 [bioreactor metagenome]|uniref:Uncharacterized protein n=1 Tax=bioreactor metagenome TaxID=1076179 RepID=A0A645GTQ8_9ZZZZ